MILTTNITKVWGWWRTVTKTNDVDEDYSKVIGLFGLRPNASATDIGMNLHVYYVLSVSV